jgi:hypothetical protein
MVVYLVFESGAECECWRHRRFSFDCVVGYSFGLHFSEPRTIKQESSSVLVVLDALPKSGFQIA